MSRDRNFQLKEFNELSLHFYFSQDWLCDVTLQKVSFKFLVIAYVRIGTRNLWKDKGRICLRPTLRKQLIEAKEVLRLQSREEKTVCVVKEIRPEKEETC